MWSELEGVKEWKLAGVLSDNRRWDRWRGRVKEGKEEEEEEWEGE